MSEVCKKDDQVNKQRENTSYLSGNASTLTVIFEILKTVPEGKLYVIEKRSGNKYLLALNREGQVCFLKKDRDSNGLCVVSERANSLILDADSEKVVNEFLKVKEIAEINAAVKNKARAPMRPYVENIAKPVEETKNAVEAAIENNRMIDLADICKEIGEREGTFVIIRLNGGKLKVLAEFKSEKRAALMLRKFYIRWKLNCSLDPQNSKRLVIEENFDQNEIDKAKNDLKITIT